MNIVADDDVEPVEAVEHVHLSQMASGAKMSVQSFQIEPGADVPEHSHPHEQAGYITQGTVTFIIDGTEQIIEAGDSYVISGGETHGAVNDGTVTVEGVDIFSPPRTNPDWQQ
jgi:Uncharacterized conserved protein, contains double-stranded beta-helix domain